MIRKRKRRRLTLLRTLSTLHKIHLSKEQHQHNSNLYAWCQIHPDNFATGRSKGFTRSSYRRNIKSHSLSIHHYHHHHHNHHHHHHNTTGGV